MTRTYSAVNGDSWTVGTTGVYVIRINLSYTNNALLCLDRNIAATTPCDAWYYSPATILAYHPHSSAYWEDTFNWTGQLEAGDVLRLRSSDVTPGALVDTGAALFSMTLLMATH